ncbi:MAG: outer membrane protein assembly factor BamC, partial [Caldimonas sp.]
MTFAPNVHALRGCILIFALALAGCSSVENLLAGDKIDYHSNAVRTSGLEVPPDLTQLAKDARYQQPSGSVSASTFQSAAAASSAAPAPTPVAPQAIGDMHIERLGNARWLNSTLPPEKLFPQVRQFWKDSGFVLVQDRAEAGVLETDWAENRAKLPGDIIRNTVGKVFDSAYSTGELDKFRTRIERTSSGGSDVYITHRG